MNKKILIIKTGNTIPSLLAEKVDFEDWFIAGSGLDPSHVICCAVDKGEALPPLDVVAATIITGSPAYVTDLASWNEITATFLRALHGRRTPILGVCYGHQLLAWAFGGEVGFHPAGREIGTVDIELTVAAANDALFKRMPKRFPAQASHLQSVLRLPADAVLLARNSFEPNHSFRLGSSTWGVQFHPEFSADVMRAYIRERRGDIKNEGLDPEELLESVAATQESASLLQKFAALVKQGHC